MSCYILYSYVRVCASQVNYESLCVHGRALSNNPREFISTQVLEYWKERYQPGILWIYFASEEGVMYNYPSVVQEDENYDPRYRCVLRRSHDVTYSNTGLRVLRHSHYVTYA